MARYNLYKERAWSCTVSGKTLLTYEEALLSEKKAAALLEAFPVVYQRAIFPLIHHSKSHLFRLSYSSMSFGSPPLVITGTTELKALAAQIAEHFRVTYVQGEVVDAQIDSKR